MRICQTKNQLKICTNQLLENLKKEIYSSFTGNMWGADLADMQLINRFNKETGFLLCVIDIFSYYVWVIPLKGKKVLQLMMLFKKSQMNPIANQIKYGKMKTVNFTTG